MDNAEKNRKDIKIPAALLILCIAATILSLIKARNYLIWILEAAPVIAGIIILTATRKKFQFTNIVYIFLAFVIIIVLIGAHYTYERVPLFSWLKQIYGMKRNNYDRVGHFLQGFVTAFVAREILVRKFQLRKRKLLAMLVICICLALSAFYELIEWAVAIIGGGPTHDFLGAQGDKWDSHWDMFLALVGSIIMVSAFSKLHDKYIKKLE